MEELKERIKALISQAQTWFAQLTAREKRLVGGAAAGVIVFILFALLVSFANSARKYRKTTAQKLEKLAQVQMLAGTYRDAQQVRQQVEQRLAASNVSLISYVEEKAKESGLQVPTMNPRGDVPLADGKIVESSVELTLTDVKLRELVQFLSTIEQAPGIVKVTELRLQPRPADETLTAMTTISTYRLK